LNKNEFIADFITNARLADFPDRVIFKAKLVLLDALGVGLAGTSSRASEITRRFIASFPMGPEEARLWGRPGKTSCLWAAWANSVAASCLDADDGHREALGHPGGVIVPVAMALAERLRASGRDLLEAIVVGYEVGLRVGMFLNRDQVNTFYGSGTWTALGAAAAGARLLCLGPKECLHALGVAEVNTPLALIMNWISLRQPPEVKEGMGWGALTGLSAALLAEQGLLGVFSMPEQPGGEIIIRDLGRNFEITRIYFKQHSACRWTHSAIDGIIQALREHDLKQEMIQKIVIATHRKAANLDNPRPAWAEAAQYSIPFTVATALIHGRIGPDQMGRVGLSDQKVLALADKVIVECDTELDKRYPETSMARVTIKTTNSQTIVVLPKEWTKGDCQDPFTGPELEEKFRLYAGHILLAGRVDAIIKVVKDLEGLRRVDELTELLVP